MDNWALDEGTDKRLDERDCAEKESESNIVCVLETVSSMDAIEGKIIGKLSSDSEIN